jgi:hypothetical protein
MCPNLASQEIQSMLTSCGITWETVKVVWHRGWQVACRDNWNTIFIQTCQLFIATRHPTSHWRCFYFPNLTRQLPLGKLNTSFSPYPLPKSMATPTPNKIAIGIWCRTLAAWLLHPRFHQWLHGTGGLYKLSRPLKARQI